MTTLHFDGADDWVRGTGQGAMNGAITLAVVSRRTATSAAYQCLLGAATAANARSFMFAHDQGVDPERITIFDNATNRYSTTTIADANSDWWVIAMTKAAGSVVPRFHFKNLTTGAAAVHETEFSAGAIGDFPSCSGGYLKIGNYDLTPGTPGSAEEDYTGDIGVVGWWDQALSDAQVDELYANKRTSDWAKNSAGVPSSLTELTAATPVDLTGIVTWVTTGAALSGPDPTGWTFDGLGPKAAIAPGRTVGF